MGEGQVYSMFDHALGLPQSLNEPAIAGVICSIRRAHHHRHCLAMIETHVDGSPAANLGVVCIYSSTHIRS